MKRDKDLRARVTREERKRVEENAKKLNMNVADYIRKVAQNPNIIHFNYSAIEEHTNQIGRIEDSINLLIYTIYLNNDYLPKEIEGILNYIKEVWETENELLDEVRKQWINASKRK